MLFSFTSLGFPAFFADEFKFVPLIGKEGWKA
jgi:hypothetical protein